MLVLSRRIGESIHIGDQIEIVVTKVSANQVRIGIVAPKEVPILRSELAARECDRPASYVEPCLAPASDTTTDSVTFEPPGRVAARGETDRLPPLLRVMTDRDAPRDGERELCGGVSAGYEATFCDRNVPALESVPTLRVHFVD